MPRLNPVFCGFYQRSIVSGDHAFASTLIAKIFTDFENGSLVVGFHTANR